MAVKKSDLYSSLWASCDALRGGMDASQYKDYVLFMLFIKYVSDKYANSDDFAPPVVIPEGASFQDMVELKGKKDIGDKINTQIIAPLVQANTRLARSDFPDFNDPNKLGDGDEMVERLTDLISIFQKPELDFSKNRAENDDLLGDAYEYLMRHFATESGKSKGQFYTPSEVSRVIAQVIGISPTNSVASTSVYDPTCGSGSLLLKVAAQAGKHVTLEGQEKDVTTAGLARMNMILHDFPTANVQGGSSTLANPKFRDGEALRTYDYVVANPPFSDKAWTTGFKPNEDKFQRFTWGEPPTKQGDYAYLLHIIRSMKSNGKAACILPHGVLFRGNAEAVIRRKLVESGILKGIIGLPANLFYGTGIPACILVLDKENAQGREGIMMIDASKGFMKDGPKNRLREQDIHRIVDTFHKAHDVPRYARVVPRTEIADARNDFNLNLPRYIDSSEPEDIQDITGHLKGGIPERDLDDLDAYWQNMPNLRATLFKPLRDGYSQLTPALSDLKPQILQHSEFNTFQDTIRATFKKWRAENQPKLADFKQGDKPRELIETLSEELLHTFQNAPLVNAYDIYQHLMDYWTQTMQDDADQISGDGWVARPTRIIEIDKKGKKKDKGWTCDLLPKPFIVARYFSKEQAELDEKQGQLEAAATALSELEEEHAAEGGVLNGVTTKVEAEDAYTESLVSAWATQDPVANAKYLQAQTEAAEAAEAFRSLSESPYIHALKGLKGKIKQKDVKDRIAAVFIDNDERVHLMKYLTAEKKLKETEKRAETLLNEATPQLIEGLQQEPLPEEFQDLHVLAQYMKLLDEVSQLKSEVKEAASQLDQKAHDQYAKLTEADVKTLVVEDKWLAEMERRLNGELDRVSQRLTGRIRELAERYHKPLPQLELQVTDLAARVEAHLARMAAQ